MDMVCEKTPESNHDFSKDPVKHITDGDWLKADNTTLGADNGIALAMAMTAVLEDEIEHPPLELLFTTDEEIGLKGAAALDSGFADGKILLNIDSEETGIFTTGCAGSSRTFINIPAEKSSVPDNHTAFKIETGGLLGGHSAMDINKSRGNANALLIRGLSELSEKTDISLSHISGGTAMNAIARAAEAVITADKNNIDTVKKIWSEFSDNITAENNFTEKNIFSKITETDIPDYIFKNSRSLINKLRSIPHGTVNMNPQLPNQLETSLNFGIIDTTESSIKITTMQRSSLKTRLEDLTAKIKSLAGALGGEFSIDIFTDPWEPDMDSSLLKRCLDVWKNLYSENAEIEITHGGLECGVIKNKSGEMDTISFGPDIESPHSPAERLYIPSVEKVFNFLTELLKSYKT